MNDILIMQMIIKIKNKRTKRYHAVEVVSYMPFNKISAASRFTNRSFSAPESFFLK